MKFVGPLAFVVTSLSCVQGQVGLWGQCGGIGYTGSTVCASGAVCTKQNDYYSQCIPSANTPSPSSNPTTPTPKPTPSTLKPSTSSPSTPSPPSSGVGKLPTNFTWTSTGPLVSAKNDGRNIRGVKDPTIVQIGDTYHVFGSVVSEAVGYNMVYFSFKDFALANQATFYYLVNTPIGPGYRAAPELFYFEPQNLWYLVFQNSNVAYSTNKDITNPNGRTVPKQFYTTEPSIITQKKGNGGWVDMFVICDSANCYLFSSDDNGHLYRAQTSISNFPNGMSQPVIAMQATDIYSLFEASAVYKAGNQYLLIVEAIGSDGQRYFRSWTSNSIAGTWTPLADTEAKPFARSNNVVFPGGAWTKSISHGELIRTQTDQTITLDLCKPIRFLYQGLDPSSGGSYNDLPWQLALLTQTNSPGC
ncbi:hypothetical protein AeMF1_017436 [Aphanomyces euteiches]|nr:hypothetical protein AeMF1_017436 [Aphanomyces euteiches]KAH9185394.1 hypothetical protein AeNC1_012630 [Aphanomyces euteiches]